MFVHGFASTSPGIGGTSASLPVATTTASRAVERALADLDAPLGRQPRAAADQGDPALLEPRELR